MLNKVTRTIVYKKKYSPPEAFIHDILYRIAEIQLMSQNIHQMSTRTLVALGKDWAAILDTFF